jgi:hypothetical protein
MKQEKDTHMEQKQQRFSIGYVMSAFVVLLMIQNYFATPHTGKSKW